MKTVDEMIEDILTREGGFVDDAADAGGATQLGISLRYARGIGLDLDGDGDTDVDDIRLVTKIRAAELYREDFFLAPGINRLPAELQPQLFDISVNMGGHRAIELLQRTTNFYITAMDDGIEISEDGRMGPKTRRAVEAMITSFGIRAINNRLVDRRIAFYADLCARKPSQNRFYRGWEARAKEFLIP